MYSVQCQVISRYESEFGERNYKFRVRNVDFLAVDAQTLDGERQWKFSLGFTYSEDLM